MPAPLLDPFIWFILAFVLIILEGFDGSFSIFATSGVAALVTSGALYFALPIHPLVIFTAALVISYVMFRYIFKMTAGNKDINKLD